MLTSEALGVPTELARGTETGNAWMCEALQVLAPACVTAENPA
ncbi:MAG: hypothetical protein WCI74_09180 [Actinomycetes bacterium]